MATPLRKEIPSTERITVRLTDYELGALEKRAGARKSGGYIEGRIFADFIRSQLGLPERRRVKRR